MAEGMCKKFYGHRHYIQSAGVLAESDIDGFAVAVCAEIGVALERHRARSFEEMEDWGEDLSGYDLIVAMTPAAQRRALELTRSFHLELEYWPVLDPTGLDEGREKQLALYRQTRDQIRDRMIARFGPPVAGTHGIDA